jgi:hypothetical protein
MARFKYLIAILLAVISTSAMAEWNFINGTDDYDTYADKTTIRLRGNIARMWTLRDYKSPQKKAYGTYISAADYYEFDCFEEKVNLLSGTAYSKNMQEGEVVKSFNYDDKDWRHIAPGTIVVVLWVTACGNGLPLLQ